MEEKIQDLLLTKIVAENCLWFKILELAQENEAVLKDIIARKKIMLLRTVLREIKKEQAEKFQEVFYCPSLPFISEESHIKAWENKEIMLLVNPNSMDK